MSAERVNILEVEQENAVAVTDDVYVKIGDTFRRVPVSALLSHVLNSTGVCSTAAATTDKTVSITGYSLYDGARAIIKFNNAVPANATLNISSTGAKALRYKGAAITAGILQAGCIALIAYDGTYYNVVTTDTQYILPDSGIPESALAEAVQEKLNAGSGTGATFIHLSYYDGEYYPDVDAADIYEALDEGDADFILIDRYGRNCILVSPPDNALTGEALFVTFTGTSGSGGNAVFYSVPVSGGISSFEIAFGGSVTWNDVKPYGGVPASDLAAGAKPFYVTISAASGGGYTADKTETEILAAVAANQVVMCKSPDGVGYYSASDDGAEFIVSGGTSSTRRFVRYVIDGSTVSCATLLAYTKPSGGIPDTDLTEAVQKKLKPAGQGSGYATCSTAAATAAKTASLTDYELVAGGTVSVKFTYAVPASATLSINSKTAKAIYYQGAAITANVIQAGDTATFRYDGSYYHLVSLDRQSSGGSGVERFKITLSESSNVISSDQTLSDILAAISANKLIEVVMPDGERGILGFHQSTSGNESVEFVSIDSSGGGSTYQLKVYYMTSSGITCNSSDIINSDPVVDTVTGATPSFAAQDNHIYKCGTLTSLTLTSIPSTGSFTVIFTSGSTATTFTEPSGMVMPDNFSIAANTRYEINVSDGYAVVASWAVSSS